MTNIVIVVEDGRVVEVLSKSKNVQLSRNWRQYADYKRNDR